MIIVRIGTTVTTTAKKKKKIILRRKRNKRTNERKKVRCLDFMPTANSEFGETDGKA